MTVSSPSVFAHAPSDPQTARQGDGVSGASSRGSHRLGAALACARLWAFRYLAELVGKSDKDYLVSGALVHTHLAYYYAGVMQKNGLALPAWFTHGRPLAEQLELDAIGMPHLLENAAAIFAWWKKHHGSPWPGYPISVEEEFSARLGDIIPNCPPDVADEVVTCRVDLLDVRNGSTFQVDHKTQQGNSSNGKLAKWGNNGGFDLSLQSYQNMRILRHQPGNTMLKRYPLKGLAIHRVKRSEPYVADLHPVLLPGPMTEEAPRTIVEAVRAEKRIEDGMAAGEKPPPNVGYHCNKCDYSEVCRAKSHADRKNIINDQFVHLPGRSARRKSQLEAEARANASGASGTLFS